ncbi:hypothetical protein D770_20230 [Flammeovirgaceae bacterium 311]|nr:hypothetical protein D770_20230 [Flammeovirgaceae bacterium 311]
MPFLGCQIQHPNRSAGLQVACYMDAKNLTTDQIEAYIKAELGDWSANVSRLLAENVEKKKLTLTKGLQQSFEEQVQDASGKILGRVIFVFSDHGRHHDMRNLLYTKQPPVEAMEEFVRKLGVSKFKYVPGYKEGKIPSESIAVKRLAWAISKGRLKSYRHKPRKWFAKQFYGQINVLIGRLIEGYQESLVNQAKTGLGN